MTEKKKVFIFAQFPPGGSEEERGRREEKRRGKEWRKRREFDVNQPLTSRIFFWNSKGVSSFSLSSSSLRGHVSPPSFLPDAGRAHSNEKASVGGRRRRISKNFYAWGEREGEKRKSHDLSREGERGEKKTESVYFLQRRERVKLMAEKSAPSSLYLTRCESIVPHITQSENVGSKGREILRGKM